MREFGFEVGLCALLERDGLPGFDALRPGGVLSRQLGTSVHAAGARIVDVVYVEPGPAYADRVALTGATIPDAAIEADVGVGRFVPEIRAIEGPPARAREVAEAAADVGYFERERRGGRMVVRRTARYPDWFGRLVGIENKPDLGTPGDLARQLRMDASTGVLDAAILATESYVTRAHLHRIPDRIGVWRVDRDALRAGSPVDEAVEVVREAGPLAPDRPGIEPVDWRPGAVDVRVIDPAAKARQRRRIAERAYGKGWRTFDWPACANGRPSDRGGATLPHCDWKDRIVDPAAECGPGCGGHDPAAPATVDRDAEREANTAWVADPPGAAREQAGLDSFGG